MTQFYSVRAIKPVKHDGVDRVPGDVSTQDFVVDVTTRDALVAAGRVTVNGRAQAPVSKGMTSVLLAKSNGRAVGLYDQENPSAGDMLPDLLSRERRTIASRLISGYLAQYALDSTYGPKLLPRATLPVAADVPTITYSATVPSADADAAAQVIWPFGADYRTADPVPVAAAAKKMWLSGHSQYLRPRGGWAQSHRLSSSLAAYGQNSSQDIDPVSGYGVTAAVVKADLILTGDVLFFGTDNGAAGAFEIEVNGSLVTAAAGAGLTQQGGRAYYPSLGSNGFVKIKFGTVDTRHIVIRFGGNYAAGSLWTRATATLLPFTTTPITWCHQGDSFSVLGAVSTPTLSISRWLVDSFGDGIDFINCACNGGSMASVNMIGAGAASVVGQINSMRNQYRLNAKPLKAQVWSTLIGINDDLNDLTAVQDEMAALLDELEADSPNALKMVFAVNANPTTIARNALAVEAAIAAACGAYKNVMFFPMQSAPSGPFLRGTGYVGNAQNNGNADVLVSADQTHPADFGAKVTGQWMARRAADRLAQWYPM